MALSVVGDIVGENPYASCDQPAEPEGRQRANK